MPAGHRDRVITGIFLQNRSRAGCAKGEGYFRHGRGILRCKSARNLGSSSAWRGVAFAGLSFSLKPRIDTQRQHGRQLAQLPSRALLQCIEGILYDLHVALAGRFVINNACGHQARNHITGQ